MDLEQLLPDIPKWAQWLGLIFTVIGGMAIMVPVARWLLLQVSRLNTHLAAWLASLFAWQLAEETFKMGDPARMVAWVGGYVLFGITTTMVFVLFSAGVIQLVLEQVATTPLPLPKPAALGWVKLLLVAAGTFVLLLPYLSIQNAMFRFWRLAWPGRHRRRRLARIALLLSRAGYSEDEAAAMMRRLVANLCTGRIKRKDSFTPVEGSEAFSDPAIVALFERGGVQAVMATLAEDDRLHP